MKKAVALLLIGFLSAFSLQVVSASSFFDLGFSASLDLQDFGEPLEEEGEDMGNQVSEEEEKQHFSFLPPSFIYQPSSKIKFSFVQTAFQEIHFNVLVPPPEQV